jgi:signal transduction histidine kinase
MTSQPDVPKAGVGARARYRRTTLARRWLTRTFAGLTWSRFAIYCLLLLPFALSRPSTVVPLLNGAGWAAVAIGTGKGYILTWLRFTPILLGVVAVANRGPREGWRLVSWLAAANVLGAAVGVALFGWVIGLLFDKPMLLRAFADDSFWTAALRWAGLAGGDLVLSGMATAFAFYLKSSADAAAALQKKAHDREQIERENAEARFAIMQAQIEPHFLFNALASIRRLYETDAVAGRSMLQHLSRYLAASLPLLRESRSTLGRELALAVAYLNVQQIRMGARLAIEVDVPPDIHAIEVPPMMIVTLVENAVIHGLAPLPQGGRVRISALVEGTRARIEVADSGRGLQDEWGVGVGLANIRARLHSQFGNAADLALRSRPEGGVTAVIDLPLDASIQPLAA